MIELYTDGSCEPINPGGNGVAGAVLYTPSRTDGRTRLLGSGMKMSNNVAEYEGVKLGLEICLDHNIVEDFIIYSDSTLVINQMLGKWKAKSGLYLQSYLETKDFFQRHFKTSSIRIEWVAGTENPADGLTRFPFEVGCKSDTF